MNDAGREVLVAAALRGQKQIRGRMRDGDGGLCAIGVLLQALGMTLLSGRNITAIRQTYEITYPEWVDIPRRNDRGEDFLTIARKLGTGDDPVL